MCGFFIIECRYHLVPESGSYAEVGVDFVTEYHVTSPSRAVGEVCSSFQGPVEASFAGRYGQSPFAWGFVGVFVEADSCFYGKVASAQSAFRHEVMRISGSEHKIDTSGEGYLYARHDLHHDFSRQSFGLQFLGASTYRVYECAARCLAGVEEVS